MKPLVLAALLLLTVSAVAQQRSTPKARPRLNPELVRLRNDYVEATKEYKQSLTKLLTFYQADVVKMEDKLALSRKLLAEGLIGPSQVEEIERSLVAAKNRVSETQRQLAGADDQIAAVLNEAQLQEEYKKAVVQRKRERKPRCSNWTLTAYHRETARTVESGYRFVCR
jgi:predicted  nucleic acid-binding Zn-ribbon protein